eukprot:scaffold234792_cov20-Prasinocladus_malaysianus.AAC.1
MCKASRITQCIKYGDYYSYLGQKYDFSECNYKTGLTARQVASNAATAAKHEVDSWEIAPTALEGQKESVLKSPEARRLMTRAACFIGRVMHNNPILTIYLQQTPWRRPTSNQ